MRACTLKKKQKTAIWSWRRRDGGKVAPVTVVYSCHQLLFLCLQPIQVVGWCSFITQRETGNFGPNWRIHFSKQFSCKQVDISCANSHNLCITNLNHYIMTKHVDHSYNYRVGRPAIIPSTVVINDASVLKVISMKTFPVTVQEAKNGCEWWRERFAWQWSVCPAVPTKERINWSCEVISTEETGVQPQYETAAHS